LFATFAATALLLARIGADDIPAVFGGDAVAVQAARFIRSKRTPVVFSCSR
jgi:hypothetical protein